MGIRTINLPYRHRIVGRGLGGILAKIGSLVKPILRSTLRSTAPIAKKVAKDLARQGMTMAGDTVGDVLAGSSFKNAITAS